MKNEIKEVAAATDYLGKSITMTVDRPLHSKHPKFGWSYRLNYGFVPGTRAPDGEELDAYLIGVDEPVEHFTGVCVAVIHRTNDNDDKLVIVPEDRKTITDDEIRAVTHFQEQYFASEILR